MIHLSQQNDVFVKMKGVFVLSVDHVAHKFHIGEFVDIVSISSETTFKIGDLMVEFSGTS